jgi:hypothetical protein
MKKTLLIAAAALAAGIISTEAQSNVYSANIVGYVNTSIPGNNALTMIANPLQVVDSNGKTNYASSALSGLAGGETLYVWKGNGYYVYSYAGAGQGTGLGYASDWYDLYPGTGAAIPGSTYDSVNQVYWTPQPVLPPGQAAFLQNGNTTFTNTFVGNAITSNTNAPVVIPGNNALTFVSSPVPIGGNIEGTNFNLPFVGGETIYIWKGNGYYGYSYAGAGQGTGLGYASDFYDLYPGTGAAIPGSTYDSVNQVYWTPALNLSVGEGFIIQNGGSTLNWTMNLNTQ